MGGEKANRRMRTRVFRGVAWVALFLALLPVLSATKAAALAVVQDGPLTRLMNLRGRTDENGYLRVSGGIAGSTDGPLTPMANLRGRTDENGYLRVSLADIAGSLTLTNDGIGTTSTSGFNFENNTAAAAGAQQYSPRTCWEGQGWKTDATAASQSVVFCLETQPVQGTSAPSGNFILKASINGGAFSTVGTFTSAGNLIAPDYIQAGAGQGFYLSSRAFVRSSASGVIDLVNENGNNFTRLRLGHTSGNTYDITLAAWGTTLSAEGVSMADAAVASLGAAPLGKLVITIGTDNEICEFELRGSSNAVREVRDGGTICSTTAATGTSINVYWDAGDARYEIENTRGGARVIRAVLIGG